MAPPPRPTFLDRFFANYQYPILLTAFATQVGHYQYIQRTSPAIESSIASIRPTGLPRPLRAGLVWALVFAGLLTKITLSQETEAAVENHGSGEYIGSSPGCSSKSGSAPWPRDNTCASPYQIPPAMSADFWAGYISGAAGILIGNPLDLIKVRLQASSPSIAATSSTPLTFRSHFSTAGSLINGSTAPILGYGALNALLFVTYNRTCAFLNTRGNKLPPNLWTTWIAGSIGGLATWVVSTPTELVKCRVQISTSRKALSTWTVTKQIIKTEGIKGLYFGGAVTALRDSVGYGFYFCAYEWSSRLLMSRVAEEGTGARAQDAAKVLLCGGFAGVVTWASIFPLDVIKTRVQTQSMGVSSDTAPLLGLVECPHNERLGAVEIARNTYRTEGVRVFFRGLGICSLRAFIVNAAQWAVYEWIMRELDPERKHKIVKGTDIEV